jgi:hypothetical protein
MTVIIQIASVHNRAKGYGSYAFLAVWPGGRISKCGPLANASSKRDCDAYGILQALQSLLFLDLKISKIIIRGKYEAVETRIRGALIFQHFTKRRSSVMFWYENDQPVDPTCYALAKTMYYRK